jgi:lipopolysaccharide export system permease protein
MMMDLIDRYIFRTIFGAFILVLFNLTAVIWITQILRRIDIITNQGQTILVFLRITGLLVPILMLVIAPIAIMIAVCYALIKLNGDSELVVMNAAGIAPRRVFRPVLAACLFVAAFVAVISAYLGPQLQRQMDEAVAKVGADVVANIVRPGAFTSVERGLILHIRDRVSENQFRGVFIDDSRNADERTTIVAEYGQIVQRLEGTFLVMRDGNVERRRPRERDPTIVLFDQYAFDLTRPGTTPEIIIGLREKYVWELLFPKPDDRTLKNSPGQFRVELHERLIAPIYPLAFGVIAFTMLGFPRTTRQSRVVSLVAVIAGVSGLRLSGFAAMVMAVNFPPALIGLYAALAATLGYGGFLIWHGRALELDEKVNLGAKALGALLRLEHFPAGHQIRLPFHSLLRRLGSSAASGDLKAAGPKLRSGPARGRDPLDP